MHIGTCVVLQHCLWSREVHSQFQLSISGGWRLHSWQWYWWWVHLWFEVCRWELYPQAQWTWNLVDGERWTQHQWISILPVHREDSMVGWQACGVRQCDRRHGCCKEDRGCRLSVRQDSQASGHCWLRLFVGPWALVDVATAGVLFFRRHLLSSSWGHLMTSDKSCAQYETSANWLNWLQCQTKRST